MADARDQTHGRTGFKRPAKKKVKPSTTPKKRKGLPHNFRYRSTHRSRVNIGLAFERWRELKAENGLRSDAEVALCLLDE